MAKPIELIDREFIQRPMDGLGNATEKQKPPDLEAIRARAKSAMRDRAALTVPPRDAGRIPELVADIDTLLAEVERLAKLNHLLIEEQKRWIDLENARRVPPLS